MTRAPLPPGAEAFVLVTRPIGRSGKRFEVQGIARVRVLEEHAGGRYERTRVVVVSSSELTAGRELELARAELYAVGDRDECRAFAQVVRRFWGDR